MLAGIYILTDNATLTMAEEIRTCMTAKLLQHDIVVGKSLASSTFGRTFRDLLVYLTDEKVAERYYAPGDPAWAEQNWHAFQRMWYSFHTNTFDEMFEQIIVLQVVLDTIMLYFGASINISDLHVVA